MTAKNEAEGSAVVKVPPLVEALKQTEQVKHKVQECADGLSSINKVLDKHDITERLPAEDLGKAVNESIEIENKVQECAEDLSLLNETLSEEISEREHLERDLKQGQVELAAAKTQEKEARQLALHDALTGLPNRRLFEDRLDHALAQAGRYRRRLAVMFIDLDKFKMVNDAYGHDVGDQLLNIIAARLQSSVRKGDTIARHAGDEFLYLMLEPAGDDAIVSAARKLLGSVAQNAAIAGKKVSVNPSIGIARYPEDGTSADVLLKNADAAMYKAKRSGKGFDFYSS